MSTESRLPINVFDSGFVVNQLPGHSGATAADFHRLPFYSQRFINVLETEEPYISAYTVSRAGGPGAPGGVDP